MTEAAKEQQDLITTDNGGILALIEKMSVNPDVDPDKLEKMLDMQERIYRVNAERAFNDAMVKCQKEIPTIHHDARNAQTNSTFAKLETMQQKAMPVITENGFCLSYGTKDCPLEDHYRVTCLVSHTGGHSREYQADIPLDNLGAKGNPNKTRTHGAGSSLSYGQRYLMKMIFNITVSGMDNDGNGDVEKVSEEQAADIRALVDETGADVEKFLKFFGADTIESLPAKQYKRAIGMLETKRKQQ